MNINELYRYDLAHIFQVLYAMHDAHILLEVGCQLFLSLVLVMPFSWMHFGRVGPGLVRALGFPLSQPCICLYLVRICKDLIRVAEGSLEVKLPTIWTDEKHSREEAERRERLEERRVEEKESEESRCRCAKR